MFPVPYHSRSNFLNVSLSSLKTKTRRKYLFCGVILCRKIRETPYNLRQNVIKNVSVYFHPLKSNKKKLIITSPMKAYHIKTMSMINKQKTIWDTIQSSIHFLKYPNSYFSWRQM